MKLILTDAHEYYLESGGKRRRILGCTEVLQNNQLIDFSGVDADVLEWARTRGQLIHEVTALDDEGDLLESSVDDRIRPYLDAWRRFRAEREVRFTGIERRGYDKIWGFAGTTDRIGTIEWKGRRRKFVGDIKPPGKKPYWKLQLVAYSLIFYPTDLPIRATISLGPDGKYQFNDCPEEEFFKDKADWLALLRASQIRQEMAG